MRPWRRANGQARRPFFVSPLEGRSRSETPIARHRVDYQASQTPLRVRSALRGHQGDAAVSAWVRAGRLDGMPLADVPGAREMTIQTTTRFRAELAFGTSPRFVIMSGDVDAYGLEELLAAARRYATRVRVQLAGAETHSARRFVERRLARLSNLGIEVMLACD
jgi:hypothetical protein